MMRFLHTRPGNMFHHLHIPVFAVIVLAAALLLSGNTRRRQDYTAFSRCTDPGSCRYLLRNTPRNVCSLCSLSRCQVVHHLVFMYQSGGDCGNKCSCNAWSARAEDILSFHRQHHKELCQWNDQGRKFVGTCTSEACLLACLLRYHGIPVRIRAGFLTHIRTDISCVENFWRRVTEHKADMAGLRGMERDRLIRLSEQNTRRENADDHRIEHWICEYFDRHQAQWRLLDANTDFLKYHSNIEVGFHLPPQYFEFSYQAWLKMRDSVYYHNESYREEQQDGRSHIRSILLWDFYSLLNHDLAGVDHHKGQLYQFVKNKRYHQLSGTELAELDELARLMLENPDIKILTTFYRKSKTLRFPEIEADSYSFVYRGNLFANGN
ncbi:MAG: hypothetical protein ACOCX8_00135 [Bacteroidota bacterium]